MNKTIKQILILICLIVILILPYFVFAANPLDMLKDTGTDAGYAEATDQSMAQIAGTVVSAFLGLLGIIFIILMLYGGYQWMTARGNEEQVNKAKDIIRTTIIGLIIIIGSYAIWNFIFYNFIMGIPQP